MYQRLFPVGQWFEDIQESAQHVVEALSRAWPALSWDVPAERPFAALNLGRPVLAVHDGNFHFVSTAPQVAGQR